MRLSGSRPRRRVALRGTTAVVGFALLVTGLGVGTNSAGAQEGFINGEANGQADGFSLTLSRGNTDIGLVFGRSLAQYRNTTGSSQASALDLGALPALFGLPQCDGAEPPLLNMSTLTNPSLANSGLPGEEDSQKVQGFLPGLNQDPPGPPVGFQHATATKLPSSWASTTSEPTFPTDLWIIGMTNVTTESTTKLENGVREARAVTTADELRVMGSYLTFYKPKWEAVARSGGEASNTGGFTFQNAVLRPPLVNVEIPVSYEDARWHFDNVNEFALASLSGLGASFTFPEVEVRDDGVEVTPMTFNIKDPPLGTDLIAPIYNFPYLQALREQALALDCKEAGTQQLLDLVVETLSGLGSIRLTAGGVQARTAATDFDVAPFPEFEEPPPLAESAPPVEGTAPPLETFSELPSDTGGFESLPFEDTGFAPIDTIPTTPTVAPAEPTTEVALPSTKMGGLEDGTAGKAAVLVGILSLVGALALSLGDRLAGQRSRRRIL